MEIAILRLAMILVVLLSMWNWFTEVETYALWQNKYSGATKWTGKFDEMGCDWKHIGYSYKITVVRGRWKGRVFYF